MNSTHTATEQMVSAKSQDIPKHERLINSIEKLREISDHLSQLESRIQQQPNETMDHESSPFCSLKSLLDEGPGYLENLYGEIHEKINQLDKQLFG